MHLNVIKSIFLAALLLSASQISIAQDMSGWSDKTICRLANSHTDNRAYLAEAVTRKLDCNSDSKKPTITPVGQCFRSCKEFRQDGVNHFGTRSNSGFKQHTNFQRQVKSHNFELMRDRQLARRGIQFQRFELRSGDCYSDGWWDDCSNDRQRVEYSAKPNQKPLGKQCYAFSIKLDESFVDIYPTKTSLGQIHQKGGPMGTAGGLKSFPPLIQFNADYGIYAFGWHELSGDASNVSDIMRRYELAEIEHMLGVWTDVSFCLDFANKNMSVWVNGNLKHSIDKSPIHFVPKEIYFKHGIYQSFISRYKFNKDTDTTPTQIVYYDEIRRGHAIEEVDFHINPNLAPID